MKGFFISIEGLDGSGKTTQINIMKQYLENKGLDAVVLREPGGTRIGEKIREIVLNAQYTEMDSIAEALLYGASRAQMVAQKLIPLLKEGKTVICDRFIDSSLAYQGYGRELDIDKIMDVNMLAVRNILPDLTIYLDVNPETAINRRRNASQTDRLENEEAAFRKKAYRGYTKLCAKYPERIKCINGELPAEEISEIIKNYIDNLIERKNDI